MIMRPRSGNPTIPPVTLGFISTSYSASSYLFFDIWHSHIHSSFQLSLWCSDSDVMIMWRMQSFIAMRPVSLVDLWPATGVKVWAFASA